MTRRRTDIDKDRRDHGEFVAPRVSGPKPLKVCQSAEGLHRQERGICVRRGSREGSQQDRRAEPPSGETQPSIRFSTSPNPLGTPNKRSKPGLPMQILKRETH